MQQIQQIQQMQQMQQIQQQEQHTTRNPFSDEEDQIILSLAKKYTDNNQDINWNAISQNLPNRNVRQCKDRYYNYLNPSKNQGDFTKEEINIIIDNYIKHGPKWSFITRNFLPNRTRNRVKNLFVSINLSGVDLTNPIEREEIIQKILSKHSRNKFTKVEDKEILVYAAQAENQNEINWIPLKNNVLKNRSVPALKYRFKSLSDKNTAQNKQASIQPKIDYAKGRAKDHNNQVQQNRSSYLEMALI